MELNMEIKFLCENHGYFGSAKKVFKTATLPFEGLKIKDGAWNGYKTIVMLTADYNTNITNAYLEDEIFFEKSMISQIKENFKENGWEIK